MSDLTGRPINYATPAFKLFHTLSNIPQPVDIAATKKLRAKGDNEKKKD